MKGLPSTSFSPLRPDLISHRRCRILILVGLLLSLAAVVYVSPLRHVLHPSSLAALKTWLLARGAWAPFIFMFLTAAVVTAGAPRLLMAVLGGVLFGWFAGGIIALLGTLIGCWITFTYARWLGYAWLQARLGQRLSRVNDLFHHHGLLTTFVIRCAPVGNCHLMNLLLAFSPISSRAFLLGTMFGILPTTAIYALFGSAAGGSWLLRVTTAALSLLTLGIVYTLLATRSQRVQGILTLFTNQK